MKKITFKIAKKRFEDRTDIELIEFVGWTKKSKFFDKVVKEEFWAKPDNVFHQKSSHPKRKHKKIQQSRIDNKNIVDFEIAKKRFSNRSDIKLIEYNGWSKKSKFYDKIVKKTFLARPDNVFYQKSKHPDRNHNNIILKKEALEKFSDRNDIQLIEYNGWGKNSIFFDKIINETFTAIPSNVFKRKSAHPRRNIRKKISYEQAVKRLSYRDDIQLIEYNGWSKKSKFYDKIAKKYWQISPNCLYHNNSSHISLRGKKIAEIHKHNDTVINYEKAIEKLSHRKDITIKKEDYKGWTVKSKFYDKIYKDFFWRRPESVLYQNAMHPQRSQLNRTTYTIVEKNETLKNWIKNQPEPKPGYTSLQQYCRKHNMYSIHLSDLEKYCKNYRDSKTNLEVYTEELLKIKHYNKKPKEIQKLYRPDFKLAPNIFLNVDGLYWHSELQKDKWYHFNLRKEFEDRRLRTIQFREDEIREKPDIVRSIVNNLSGKIENKLFARNCKIKPVSQNKARAFLNVNHLMGTANAKHVGLFYNNDLVSILSYKCKKNICKIERFCSLNNHVVVGGFSKLLKYLEQNILKPDITEIHNWIDLRYGTGCHLENKGFKLIKDTLGWKWTDFANTFNRLKCRANMDERGLTQQEYADELGWVKIYDAGQRLWVKTI